MRPLPELGLADDMLALLDVLGVEQTGYLGHDWGGWTRWLLGIRAPERFTRIELPVKLLFGRGERPQSAGQLQGAERHVPRVEIELVDGGHWPLDQRPR